MRARDVELLRRRWDEGKASGPPREVDIPALIAREKAKTGEASVTRVALDTREPRPELESIWRAIAEENEPAADRILSAISDKLDFSPPSTARAAPSGHPAGSTHAGRGALSCALRTHPDSDEGPVDRVEVSCVVDGRRDLSEMF